MEEFIIHNRDRIFFETLSDEKIMKAIADIPVKCDELTLLENKSRSNKQHWKVNTIKIFFVTIIIAGLLSLLFGLVLQYVAVTFELSGLQWLLFLNIRRIGVLIISLTTFIIGPVYGFESCFETTKIMTLKEQIQFVQLAAALNDRLFPSDEDYIFAEKKYHEKYIKYTWYLKSKAKLEKDRQVNELNDDRIKNAQTIESVVKRLQ